ncbi:MAG: DoxX family membrane protein, partial [Bryobacteraceae bacterium]
IHAGRDFFAHGARKVLGWFGGGGYPAIIAEFPGGLGLILGLLSRLAAFRIGVVMRVAIFLVLEGGRHGPAYWPDPHPSRG